MRDVPAARSRRLARRSAPGSRGAQVGLLTVGQAAGQTASWAALVAAMPLALARPGAAGWVAILTACWSVPAALGQLFLRSAVDRLGPRAMSLICWTACAAAAVLLACDANAIWAAAAMLCVVSAGRGLAVVAGDLAPSWLPDRPDLSRAGSWLMLAAAVPVLAGPLGASSLVAGWGDQTAWLAIAGLFMLGAAGCGSVPGVRPEGDSVPGASGVTDRHGRLPSRVARVLAATAVVWLSYGAMSILQPVYVTQRLHASLTVYGWTMTAFACGGVLLSLAGLRRGWIARGRWAVALSLLGVAAGERLLTGSGSVVLALAGAFLWGTAAAGLSLASRSVIVTTVPAGAHGSVLSLWRGLQAGANALPAAVTGWLVANAGLSGALTCTWLAALAAWLVYVISGMLGRGATPRLHARTRNLVSG